MRAHGIASTATNIKPTTASRSSKSERSLSAAGSTNARKRKADQFVEDPNPADDEEGFSGNMSIKGEGQGRGPKIKQQMYVKEESEKKPLIQQQQQSQLSLEDANELLRYYTPSAGAYNATADDDLYGSGDFEVNGNSASAGFSSSSMAGGSASSGFGSSAPAASYGMHQSSRPFEYNNGYRASSGFGHGGSSGMGSSPPQASSFQQPYRVDTKGRQESPLLVE